MQYYCEQCGSPINSKGRCPNCDKKKNKSANRKRHKIFVCIVVFLAIYTFLTVTVGVLVYTDKLAIPFINDIFIYMGIKDEQPDLSPAEEPPASEPAGKTPAPENNAEDMTNSYELTPPDADAFFQNNSAVASELNAQNSVDVHTESETYANFTERGFSEYPITTEYSMDGEYTKAYEISRHSSEKHPMYQTYYVTPGGDVWLLYEINGTILANPLSYNDQLQDGVPVMMSESGTITSYDSTTNKFYINTPHASVLSVKTVGRIDAATLNTLTNGEIDKL